MLALKVSYLPASITTGFVFGQASIPNTMCKTVLSGTETGMWCAKSPKHVSGMASNSAFTFRRGTATIPTTGHRNTLLIIEISSANSLRSTVRYSKCGSTVPTEGTATMGVPIQSGALMVQRTTIGPPHSTWYEAYSLTSSSSATQVPAYGGAEMNRASAERPTGIPLRQTRCTQASQTSVSY